MIEKSGSVGDAVVGYKWICLNGVCIPVGSKNNKMFAMDLSPSTTSTTLASCLSFAFDISIFNTGLPTSELRG